MNRYLADHLNHAHRSELVAEAASNRLAGEECLPEPESEHGFRAAIRRFFSGPESNPLGFMPQLVDYPTAHH